MVLTHSIVVTFSSYVQSTVAAGRQVGTSFIVQKCSIWTCCLSLIKKVTSGTHFFTHYRYNHLHISSMNSVNLSHHSCNHLLLTTLKLLEIVHRVLICKLQTLKQICECAPETPPCIVMTAHFGINILYILHTLGLKKPNFQSNNGQRK